LALGSLQLDCRFFALGNLMAIISSLADEQQSHKILNLIELRWSDLISHMPMKLCYPALEDIEWRIITGADPKKSPLVVSQRWKLASLTLDVDGSC